MFSVDQHIAPWWRLPVACIDFETCGVDASKCGPVEIAVVRFEDGAIAGRWSTLLNPEQPIPPEATAIHAITDETVADAPVAGALYTLLTMHAGGLLEGAIPCAYNQRFDRTILHRFVHDPQVPALNHDMPWLDPMVVVKHVDKFAKGKKLTDACARRGIKIGMQAHRAEADAILAGMLLFSTDIRAALGDYTISEVLRRQTKYAADQDADWQQWKSRQGELAAMDWERIDWDQRCWVIARSWETTTKNGRTRRQELLDRSYAALRAWWEHQGRPTSGPVFPSPHKGKNGRPKRYAKGHDWGWGDHPEKNLTRLGLWRRVGLRTRIRFHDFRDTCATHLLSGTWSKDGKGWPLPLVSKFIGHSSEAVTEARYAHLTREAQRAAADNVRAIGLEKVAERLAGASKGKLSKSAKTKGSESRTRTCDQSVNSTKTGESLRMVASVSADHRPVQAESDAQRLAGEVLALVDAGRAVPVELERALAATVLDRPESRLAMRVLAGGAHALQATLELAALVLEQAPAAKSEAAS